MKNQWETINKNQWKTNENQWKINTNQWKINENERKINEKIGEKKTQKSWEKKEKVSNCGIKKKKNKLYENLKKVKS